jgi:diguanylate cyclase (GGDEF)-like protein
MVVTKSPELQSELESLLRQLEYDVVRAQGADPGLVKSLSQGAPRLLLWDTTGAEDETEEFCRRLRETGGGRYTYVLLLVSSERRERVLSFLDQGADDFAVLPLEAEELAARLLSGRRILALRERLQSTRSALREQALRDGLTGLWNRQAIMDFLEGELARSQRNGDPVGLALVAVDDIADIVQEKGHQAGDAVLRDLALRLKTSLRSSDGLGRYGEGLFLAVVGGCGEDRARSIAERVLRSITLRPIEWEGQALELSGRAGWAAASGREENAEDLIRRARESLEST